MIDLLLELLMNRLGIAILGIAFVVGGVYVWTNYRTEAKLYDAAVGEEGKTASARIRWKNQETSQSEYSDGSTTVGYFKLIYEYEGEEIEVKQYVDSDVYAKYKEGDRVDIRFHPTSKLLLVMPETKRPSTLFASVMSIGLIAFGAVIVLAVIISFF